MNVELKQTKELNGLRALVAEYGNARVTFYIGGREPYQLSEATRGAFIKRVRDFCLYNKCEVTDAQFDKLFEQPKPKEEVKNERPKPKSKRKSSKSRK